jgi:beta-ketoacyl synthase-like protein
MVITGVGMATAQGSAAEVGAGEPPSPPSPLPWPARASAQARTFRPARRAEGEGMARLAELAARALDELGPRDAVEPRPHGRALDELGPRDAVDELGPARAAGRPWWRATSEPIILASCNGGAATFQRDDWRASFELGRALGIDSPVVSAACASGIQALYLARCMLAAGAPAATVLAADVATQPSHDNFESLRIVADELAPYQPDASGFTVGEAAVAVRVARAGPGVPLVGPVLGHDLDDDDALRRVLAALRCAPELVLGQATGPAAADRAELAAIASRVDARVPLATASHHFGHALGASSLLSVALAALARDGISRALALPHATAADGRPLVTGVARGAEVLVACRALGGACGACVVGAELDDGNSLAHAPSVGRGDRRAQIASSDPHAWSTQIAPPPMRHAFLRALATDARERRPAEPPDLLVVTLDAPLEPPDDAWVGTRLLPSSVLELTPGFVAQLVARTWGYAGPAVTLVGGNPANLLAACRSTHERVFQLAIRGMDDHRDVEWIS